MLQRRPSGIFDPTQDETVSSDQIVLVRQIGLIASPALRLTNIMTFMPCLGSFFPLISVSVKATCTHTKDLSGHHLQPSKRIPHLTRHPVKMFDCARCPRQFLAPASAYQHMLACNHFKYRCRAPDCKDTFYRPMLRKDHEEEDHYYCAPCHTSFSSYNSLKMVCASHPPPGPREFLCLDKSPRLISPFIPQSTSTRASISSPK